MSQKANPDVADAAKDADILVFVVPHQVNKWMSYPAVVNANIALESFKKTKLCFCVQKNSKMSPQVARET